MEGTLYLLMALADGEVVIVPVPFAEVFREASEASGVPLDFLVSWCYLESWFDPEVVGEEKSSIGLMQMSKDAWQDMSLAPWEKAFQPQYAIPIAARYLAWLHSLIAKNNALIRDDDWRWAFAAYNWGPRKMLSEIFSKGNGSWELVPAHVRARVEIAQGGVLLPCHPDEIEDVLSLQSAQDEWRWVKECLEGIGKPADL